MSTHSSDEISFPAKQSSLGVSGGGGGGGASSYQMQTYGQSSSRVGAGVNRVRAMTQSSRQSGDSAHSRYKHIARPVPVWVVEEEQRQRHHFQSHIKTDSIPSYFQYTADQDALDQDDQTELQPYVDEGLDGTISSSARSRWNVFKQQTARPDLENNDQGFIDEKALLEQGDFSGSWLGGVVEEYRKKRRLGGHKDDPYISTARYFLSDDAKKVWKTRLSTTLLNNPLVPLTLRAIIFFLSIIALGLACSIFVHSRRAVPTPITQQPSTIMAVVVQSCALIYLVYITYDEYSGKPLGLREPKAKMRLIMLDLLFIIFSSANLSLTFNTLFDVTWTCHSGQEAQHELGIDVPYNFSICSRQRGLASFLFLVLVMWVSTFTISIFRLVERVTQ